MDDSARTALLEDVDALEALLKTDVDMTSSAAIAEHTRSLDSAVTDTNGSIKRVNDSMSEWERAEDEKKRQEAEAAAEAERTNPDNYAAISDRDWLLMERNADSHIGEQYTIYGYVTQADSFTGQNSIRANTSGEQQGRWYDYDVNTIVLSIDSDMFSNVVVDDIVKMYVVVAGTTSYDTTIGGTASAVLVNVEMIEVIG